tara:strand:+ start:6008 stop:6274 length:267 start_codon:yes stop_codon:yes gene_type:complete
MIKFTAKGTDKTTGEPIQLVGLGITKGNVKRMKKGDPIRVPMKALGLNSDITLFIFYGETEQRLKADLKEFIGPSTTVIDDTDIGNRN